MLLAYRHPHDLSSGILKDIAKEKKRLTMTKVFAHRGAAQRAQENSLAAFLEAKRLGADGIELDVRQSADGALVVHHDAQIPGIGEISRLLVSKLPSEVPLLADALEASAGMVVNVEIKNDPAETGYDPSGRLVASVVETILELGCRDEVLISSFDLATLESVRLLEPALELGWLVFSTNGLSEALKMVTDHGFEALHPFVLGLSHELVLEAHESGITINAWTVNASHDIERMGAWGVDSIITDDVELARKVLKSSDFLA